MRGLVAILALVAGSGRVAVGSFRHWFGLGQRRWLSRYTAAMRASAEDRIRKMAFGEVYPLYLTKVERKGRTQAELDEDIGWLTGYDPQAIAAHVAAETLFGDFFAQATLAPTAEQITGTICGVKIQEITDPLMKQVR